MAKIKGPLMSIAASGSVGRMNFYGHENTRDPQAVALGQSHVARGKPRAGTGAPSAAQLEQRAKVAAAAQAWATLDAETKAKWNAAGINVHPANLRGQVFHAAHGYALFVQEWNIQQVTAPDVPMIPARLP